MKKITIRNFPAVVLFFLSIIGASMEASAHVEATTGWIRPTPAGIKVTALYVQLRNTGSAPVRLEGISSPIAEAAELHAVVQRDGMMLMRPVKSRVVIVAGGELALRPGGYHVMLVGLKRPVAIGERILLRLHFSHGPALDVVAEARHTEVGADSGAELDR